MKILLSLIVSVLLLSSCTTYEGAAYIRADLDAMKCSNNSAQKTIDINTAKADCMAYTVNPEADEYLKAGVSVATIDWIREVHRRTYRECMDGKGFACSWYK